MRTTTQTKTTRTSDSFLTDMCHVELIVYQPPAPPPVNVYLIAFETPVSELEDLQGYSDNLKKSSWGKDGMTPTRAVRVFAHNADGQTPIAYRKPMQHGLQSPKGCLERIRRLLKTAPTTTIKVEVQQDQFERLKVYAMTYEVSLGEICLLAVGYYAALHRQRIEKERRKTPFAKFEKSLRDEARAAPATC